MKIIGIVGEARSGKDTLAKLLLSNIGIAGNWEIRPISLPLKEVCSELLGLPLIDMSEGNREVTRKFIIPHKNFIYHTYLSNFGEYGLTDSLADKAADKTLKFFESHMSSSLDVCSVSIRQVLQYVGTEVFRDEVSKEFWTELFVSKYQNENVIVPDIRYENEFELASKYGKTIKVNRDIQSRVNTHISEDMSRNKSDLHYDFVVDNNGTLDDLDVAAKDLFTDLKNFIYE